MIYNGGIHVCGRYLFFPDKSNEIQQIFDLANEGFSDSIKTGEIFPSELVPVILPDDQNKIQIKRMTWGFPGFKGSQLIINARTETVAEKKMFSKAYKTTRCVFPTSGFFEWNKSKEKFLFTFEKDPVYICGFYKEYNDGLRSVIMTKEADSSVAPVHNRMPLIVSKKNIKQYLTSQDFSDNLIHLPTPKLVLEKI